MNNNQNGQYQQNYNQYQQPNGNNGGSFMDKVKDFIFNTPVEQEPIAPQDIEANKTLSLISYIWILFWIPLVAAKDSKFARFHANQGLVFCLASMAVCVASTIVYTILAFIPVLGPILTSIISVAISLADLGLMVLGIYNCVKGRANELPLIGKIRIIKTSPVNAGFNNVNNNYNPQNNNFNAPQQNTNYNAVNNNAPQQNTNYNAVNNNAPQQNTGFDANAYSSGVPQQNTGFDANAYSSGTDSSNNGNA